MDNISNYVSSDLNSSGYGEIPNSIYGLGVAELSNDDYVLLHTTYINSDIGVRIDKIDHNDGRYWKTRKTLNQIK